MPFNGAQPRVRLAFKASKYVPGSSAGPARSGTARRLRPFMPGGADTPTRSRIVGMRSTNRDGARETAGRNAPFAQKIKGTRNVASYANSPRSEEHTSELQSHSDLVCRLLLEKK